MRHSFQCRCRRRAARIGPPPMGAGSGGGPVEIGEMEVTSGDGAHARYFDGTYGIAANRVEFTTRPAIPPAIPTDYVISLLSAGLGVNGRVEIGGSQGVRVTAGPPMLPPAASEATNGVEVVAGEMQEINIQRGLIPGVDQQILMTPGSPAGSIIIDGGAGPVMIKSLTSITLQVAEGLSSISLTPTGIVIEGLLVSIN